MKEISKKLIQLKGLKIKKNGKNKHQGFEYYLLSDILDSINLICKDINLLYFPKFTINNESGTMLTTIDFYDIDSGESFTIESEGFLDNQQRNPVQAGGSSQTYNLRYTLMYFLGISDNVDDPDSNDLKADNKQQPSNLINSKQKAEFRAKYGGLSAEEKIDLLSKVNLTPATFNQMTNEQFNELMKWIITTVTE